jgi:hypothetical protein
VLGATNLLTARLAPYEGWEEFTAVAKQNWSAWSKVRGKRAIKRIAPGRWNSGPRNGVRHRRTGFPPLACPRCN